MRVRKQETGSWGVLLRGHKRDSWFAKYWTFREAIPLIEFNFDPTSPPDHPRSTRAEERNQ